MGVVFEPGDVKNEVLAFIQIYVLNGVIELSGLTAAVCPVVLQGISPAKVSEDRYSGVVRSMRADA